MLLCTLEATRVTKTDILIEAVTYAKDNDMEWWEVFDSLSEAIKTIRKARKEIPEEGQIVCLLSSADEFIESELVAADMMYAQVLKAMEQELKNVLD